MTDEEEDALVDQINDARPDVLWVGIGVPKQEKWMARMRERLDVPVMCAVGAAFDFHAGRISQAPSWMQQRGLEWIYRIAQEPRRLLPRYLYFNPRFVLAFARQYLSRAPVDSPPMEASVAVIGLGRVGLPLALSFAERGLRRIGVERQQTRARPGRRGQMPFSETGTQELLERVMESGRLELTRAVQDAARADHIVLTLHTPSHVHIEIDISHVRGVIDDLLPVLREGHSLILRSTVAPGTTEWVAGYIEQRRGFRVGEDLFVSHVPERIAENHFLEEIATLPCIVGGVGESSGARAAELFEAFGTEIVQTSPVQAELAKIWTNILRYTQFALPEPPDDGVRAVRRERLRRDRADQPRLPARRDGAAGAHRGRLPAQGLHVLGGALERARACCWPCRACTRRCRCSS